MRTGRVDHVADKNDVAADQLIALVQFAAVHRHDFRLVARARRKHVFHKRQQEEKPEREQQIGWQQIEKPHSGERAVDMEKAYLIVRWLLEEIVEGQVSHHVGNGGHVLVQALHAENQCRKRKPEPRQFVIEEALATRCATPADSARILALYHFEGQLDKRKGEFFVVYPLTAQDHGQAQKGRKHQCREHAPGEKRHDPQLPGDTRSRRQMLIEVLGNVLLGVSVRVPRHGPMRDVLEELVFPAVFAGGIIIRHDKERNQFLQQTA